MSRERERRVLEIFEEVHTCIGKEREHAIAAACRGDSALEQQVRDGLAAIQASSAYDADVKADCQQQAAALRQAIIDFANGL